MPESAFHIIVEKRRECIVWDEAPPDNRRLNSTKHVNTVHPTFLEKAFAQPDMRTFIIEEGRRTVVKNVAPNTDK